MNLTPEKDDFYPVRIKLFTEHDLTQTDPKAILRLLRRLRLQTHEAAGFRLDPLGAPDRFERLWRARKTGRGIQLAGREPVTWSLEFDFERMTKYQLDTRREAGTGPEPHTVTLYLGDEPRPPLSGDLLREIARCLSEIFHPLALWIDIGSRGLPLYSLGLRSATWLQVFGPRYVQMLGEEKFVKIPAGSVERLTDGGYLITLTPEPQSGKALRELAEQWEAHLCRLDTPSFDESIRMAEEEEMPGEFDLATARGVATFDIDNTEILVEGSVEEVAGALKEVLVADVWQRDLRGDEVTLAEECWFVFRLAGHRWSIILKRNDSALDFLKREEAQAISARLGTRAIYYGVSDTAGAVEYFFYRKGDLRETLRYCGEDLSDYEEFMEPGQLEQMEFTGGLRIESREREIEDVDIASPFDFAEAFFKAQDAFDPGISFSHFVGYIMHKPGDRVPVSLPEDGSFERIDFLAVARSSAG